MQGKHFRKSKNWIRKLRKFCKKKLKKIAKDLLWKMKRFWNFVWIFFKIIFFKCLFLVFPMFQCFCMAIEKEALNGAAAVDRPSPWLIGPFDHWSLAISLSVTTDQHHHRHDDHGQLFIHTGTVQSYPLLPFIQRDDEPSCCLCSCLQWSYVSSSHWLRIIKIIFHVFNVQCAHQQLQANEHEGVVSNHPSSLCLP